MKNNFIIAGSVLMLVVLAVALISLTLNPVTTEVYHTENTSYNWYFKPRDDGQQPIVADNATFFDKYNVLYLGDPNEKTIYLTFDGGYENGTTARILDTLKEKQVPAAFFLVGHYLKSQPDLVKRMVDEGHLVCNHTSNHKNLANVSIEVFKEEVEGFADLYKQTTGKELVKYFRPPEGTYSEKMLSMADQLGYTTVFWSFAYKDWLNNNQPDPQKSIEKILKYTHPGAVILLHSTSETNAQILGEVIDRWKEEGYTLKSLDDLKAWSEN